MTEVNNSENQPDKQTENSSQEQILPRREPSGTEAKKLNPAPESAAETKPPVQEPSSSAHPSETNNIHNEPARPVRVRPEAANKVELPGPEDDEELEKEIADALGDVSLIDMLSTDKEEPKLESNVSDNLPQPSSETIPGVTHGKVVGISGEGIFIDLGGKSQGFLPKEELEEGEETQIGKVLNVAVIRYDSRDGLVILSKKTADQQLLRRNLREGTLVEARVTGSNKGGLELDIKGLKAFMPASQIDLVRVETFDHLVGEKFVCEVLQVERGDKNIVLSRRNVLKKEEQELSEKLWAELDPGQTRHGTVRSIMDYGAFIDLGGADGLLHIREMSWARIKHPRDILSVGQEIDVLVIGVDTEHKRISLSLRQAGGDPWSTVEHKYPVGSRHQVQISNVVDFGAFAELESGVEGLIPIGQMSWAGRIRHPSEVVQPGGLVEVEVLSVDIQKRRISLSMKSLQENPWANITEKYLLDHMYKGTVARVTDFGAFVTLEPGVDGLIHISELSDKHVKRAEDVVKEGQEVQVKILQVETDNRRISLTMKGIADTGQDQQEEETSSREDRAMETKKKKDRPLRGGLDWNW